MHIPLATIDLKHIIELIFKSYIATNRDNHHSCKMAKGKDPNEDFYQFISQMKDMLENMDEKERELFKNVMTGKENIAELENEKFYTYQKPDYASKAAK